MPAGKYRYIAVEGPIGAGKTSLAQIDLFSQTTVADFILDKAPLLIVNSEHLNFVDAPKDLDLLLGRIGSMRGGREFFNRAE